MIHPLNFLYADFNYIFPHIIGSFSFYELDLRREYRVPNTVPVSYGIEEIMLSPGTAGGITRHCGWYHPALRVVSPGTAGGITRHCRWYHPALRPSLVAVMFLFLADLQSIPDSSLARRPFVTPFARRTAVVSASDVGFSRHAARHPLSRRDVAAMRRRHDDGHLAPRPRRRQPAAHQSAL